MLEITEGHGDRRGLKYRGLVLHDADRAAEEARDQVMRVKAGGKGLIVVFGLGLGYHIKELADLWPQAKIVAFDPEPTLQDAYAKHAVDAEIGPDRLTIVHDWPALNDLLTQEIVHGDNPDPAVFRHPQYQTLFPKESEAFAGIINGARLRRAVMDKTIQEKGSLFLDNLAANLPDIMELPLLTKLQGRLPNRPGFIVGAGPGLEKNGSLLRNLDGPGLILAAASAWKPLLDKGVRPDMLVVVEAEDTSGFLRLAEPDPEAVLALASTAHPEHFHVPGFNRSVYHLSQGAAYILGAETFVPQAGTAGTAAFTIGLLWGLNPLVLIGQDQAFKSGRLHARGSPSPNPTPDEVTVFSVTDTEGREVQTHSAFAASLHWYTETAQYLKRRSPDQRLINASESGAGIPGIPNMTLQEVMNRLEKERRERLDPGKALTQTKRPDPDLVRGRLTQTWEIISRMSQIVRIAPEQGGRIVQDCRANHPFLHEALAGLTEPENPASVKEAIERTETLILKMLGALG